MLAEKVGVLPPFGKGKTGVPGCDCPASAVYHQADGTPSGLQECVESGARAGLRAGAPADGRKDDVDSGVVCAGSRVGGAGDGKRYDVKVSLWRGA